MSPATLDALYELAEANSRLIAMLIAEKERPEPEAEPEDVPDVVDRGWIAKNQGVSKSTIEKQPWRVPDFGRSPTSHRPLTYRYADYIEWMRVDLSSHLADWDALKYRERQRARRAV